MLNVTIAQLAERGALSLIEHAARDAAEQLKARNYWGDIELTVPLHVWIDADLRTRAVTRVGVDGHHVYCRPNPEPCEAFRARAWRVVL